MIYTRAIPLKVILLLIVIIPLHGFGQEFEDLSGVWTGKIKDANIVINSSSVVGAKTRFDYTLILEKESESIYKGIAITDLGVVEGLGYRRLKQPTQVVNYHFVEIKKSNDEWILTEGGLRSGWEPDSYDKKISEISLEEAKSGKLKIIGDRKKGTGRSHNFRLTKERELAIEDKYILSCAVTPQLEIMSHTFKNSTTGTSDIARGESGILEVEIRNNCFFDAPKTKLEIRKAYEIPIDITPFGSGPMVLNNGGLKKGVIIKCKIQIDMKQYYEGDFFDIELGAIALGSKDDILIPFTAKIPVVLR